MEIEHIVFFFKCINFKTTEPLLENLENVLIIKVFQDKLNYLPHCALVSLKLIYILDDIEDNIEHSYQNIFKYWYYMT